MTLLLLLIGLPSSYLYAQDDEPLYQQPPYDVITLNEANNNAVLKVKPLDFPGRKRPVDPPKSDRLKFVLLDKPDDQYQVYWASVEKIVLFEEMVLAEAYKLTTVDDKSEVAWETFQFLLENHPDLPGLHETLQRFLFFEASRMFKAGRPTEALAILEELYGQNPEFELSGRGLPGVMGSMIDRIMQQYTADEQYSSARKLLSRLIDDYGKPLETTTEKWKRQLEGLALARKNEAIEHGRAGRLRSVAAARCGRFGSSDRLSRCRTRPSRSRTARAG